MFKKMIIHAKITNLQTQRDEKFSFLFFLFVVCFFFLGELVSFRCKRLVSHCVGDPCLT